MTTTAPLPTVIRCDACGTERATKLTKVGKPRMPMAWKELLGEVYCAKCKRELWAVRAFKLPVSTPVEGSWDELRAALREAFAQTTAASNYAVSQFFAEDPKRMPGDAKIRKFSSPPYIYPDLRSRFPDLPAQTIVSITNRVWKTYSKRRMDVVWFGRASIPSHRYPQPIPINEQSWKLHLEEGGRLVVSILLGGRRWQLRLRGGPEFRRMRQGLLSLIRGEAVPCELSLSEIPGRKSSDHRGSELRVTIPLWMRKTPRRDGDAAVLMTGGDAFLALYSADRNRIWTWNADDVRRSITKHDRQMQRLREDLKAERRLKRDRQGIVERMDLLARHQNDKLSTFCHTAAKEVVNMLLRRGCSVVAYVDKDQSYMPHFPWHKLSTLLADKCAHAGIEFTSGGVVGEPPAPLDEAATDDE